MWLQEKIYNKEQLLTSQILDTEFPLISLQLFLELSEQIYVIS